MKNAELLLHVPFVDLVDAIYARGEAEGIIDPD